LPIPRRLTYRIAWTLTICTSLSLLGDATLYAVIPSEHQHLGLLAVQAGWILSTNRLVRPPMNLLSSWFSTELGPRTPYILGLAIGALSTLGYGLWSSYGLLLALRALWGIAWALIAVSAYSMLLQASATEERGRLVGLYVSGSFFGGSLGAILGGHLVDRWGFEPGMRSLGALSALACLLALTLPRKPFAGLAQSSGRSQALRQAWGHWRDLANMGRRLAVGLVLIFAHRLFFAGVFYGTFGYYLSRSLPASPLIQGIGLAALTAILLFLRNLLTLVTGPLLGYLSDRLGDRLRVLMLGEALGASGMLVLALGQGRWGWLGVGITLVAMAYGVVPSMIMAWLGDLSQDHQRAAIAGTYQTMGDIGSGIGPLAAYPLLAAFGVLPVYLGCAALLLATIPLIQWVRHTQPEPAQTKLPASPKA